MSNKLMNLVKDLSIYERFAIIISFIISIICIINKETIYSVLYYGFLVFSILMYGYNRKVFTASWIASELSIFIYYMLQGNGFIRSIESSGGAFLISLLTLMYITHRESEKEIIKLKNVFNVIIISFFITHIMVFAKLLSSQTNSLLIAIWMAAPAYISIAQCFYINLTYLFKSIYIATIGIITFQYMTINGMNILELLEYAILIMALIISYLHYKEFVKIQDK